MRVARTLQTCSRGGRSRFPARAPRVHRVCTACASRRSAPQRISTGFVHSHSASIRINAARHEAAQSAAAEMGHVTLTPIAPRLNSGQPPRERTSAPAPVLGVTAMKAATAQKTPAEILAAMLR